MNQTDALNLLSNAPCTLADACSHSGFVLSRVNSIGSRMAPLLIAAALLLVPGSAHPQTSPHISQSDCRLG